MQSSDWSDAEVEQLKAWVNHLTIAQIANRLGRTYKSVSEKVNSATQVNKNPTGIRYARPKITEYLEILEQESKSITKFAKENNLKVDRLTDAIKRFYPDWMEAYSARNAVKPKTKCPYCHQDFWPLSNSQIFCSRRCADTNRVDQDYFGGKRRETIGLSEGICQLCNQHKHKGLSSHHVRGKENDPENDHLIALCKGCHNIVTMLAGRRFAATEEAWEVLIQLVLLRKNGHDPDYQRVFTAVKIKPGR